MSAETHVERWTYLGTFPGQSVAAVAVWRDGNGERHAFKPRNMSGTVGGIYDVDCFDDGSGVRGSPSFTGDTADDATALKLEAEHRRHELERDRLERRAKTTPDVDAAIEPLARLAKGMPPGARAALLRRAESAIWRA